MSGVILKTVWPLASVVMEEGGRRSTSLPWIRKLVAVSGMLLPVWGFTPSCPVIDTWTGKHNTNEKIHSAKLVSWIRQTSTHGVGVGWGTHLINLQTMRQRQQSLLHRHPGCSVSSHTLTPLLLSLGHHSVRSTYLLDDVLSCDILDDGCRGGTWSGVPGRTHGWLAHWADCSREICHCEPCLPRSRPLHRGRCSLPLDWNSCHNCLVQDVKSRDQLDTKMGSAAMQGPCTTLLRKYSEST